MKHLKSPNQLNESNDLRLVTTMQKVKAIQDESGHWYVIPNDMVEEFYKDEEDNDFVDSAQFDNKYSKYRTGGDLNLIQLWANI